MTKINFIRINSLKWHLNKIRLHFTFECVANIMQKEFFTKLY